MTSIINPIWFYLMDVCGNVSFWFKVIAVLCGASVFILGIGALIWVDGGSTEDTEFKWIISKLKMMSVITFIFIFASSAIPKEDTLMKMLVAKTVTYENVEAAKQEAVDLVDYIVEKVDELMEDGTVKTEETTEE